MKQFLSYNRPNVHFLWRRRSFSFFVRDRLFAEEEIFFFSLVMKWNKVIEGKNKLNSISLLSGIYNVYPLQRANKYPGMDIKY